MSKPEWRRWPWLSWCVVAATLIGCQSIVASGVSRPRLAVLLPIGHRDDELRHNFLQSFRLGQASLEACGEPFPQVAWHWTNSGDAPDPQLMPSIDLKLLVVPPSADLRALPSWLTNGTSPCCSHISVASRWTPCAGWKAVNGSGRLFPTSGGSEAVSYTHLTLPTILLV